MNRKVMSALLVSAAFCGAPAFAADLGGDCCADLEERVAELEATTARKGNRKVSLAISGQVNTAVLFFDTEKDSNAYVVDNQNSNSRFRLVGEAKVSPTLSAGFYIELGVGLGAESSRVTEFNETNGGDDGTALGDSRVEIRHANWYLNHKQLGKLTVGRGSMSTDGITEIDLVGINVLTLNGFAIGNDFQVGGARFDTVATGTYELERNNMVRYDTPTVGGFQGTAAWGEDDRWDVALRYAGEIAVNHCAPDAQRSGQLDALSTSDEPITRYAHIHCAHTDELFSKHAFMDGCYTRQDVHHEPVQTIRNYCLTLSLRSVEEPVLIS